jgi:hypothetical protein
MTEVYTGRFFLLEGIDIEKNELTVLAVGFDELSIIKFVKELSDSNNQLPFHAFRVIALGGVLKQEGAPNPTHSAPVTPV